MRVSQTYFKTLREDCCKLLLLLFVYIAIRLKRLNGYYYYRIEIDITRTGSTCSERYSTQT